jgi:hypothetical protein
MRTHDEVLSGCVPDGDAMGSRTRAHAMDSPRSNSSIRRPSTLQTTLPQWLPNCAKGAACEYHTRKCRKNSRESDTTNLPLGAVNPALPLGAVLPSPVLRRDADHTSTAPVLINGPHQLPQPIPACVPHGSHRLETTSFARYTLSQLISLRVIG